MLQSIKIITRAFLITANLVCVAQIDSSAVKQFSRYPEIVKTEYIINYRGRNKKEEGWVVTYKNAAASSLFRVKNASPETLYQMKVGLWKGYYKNGSYRYLDSASINDSVSSTVLTEFDKKGNIKAKYYNSNSKEMEDRYTSVGSAPAYSNTSEKALHNKLVAKLFYKNGQVKSIIHLCEGKPCGKDVYYYKDGRLKKEVLH